MTLSPRRSAIGLHVQTEIGINVREGSWTSQLPSLSLTRELPLFVETLPALEAVFVKSLHGGRHSFHFWMNGSCGWEGPWLIRLAVKKLRKKYVVLVTIFK